MLKSSWANQCILQDTVVAEISIAYKVRIIGNGFFANEMTVLRPFIPYKGNIMGKPDETFMKSLAKMQNLWYNRIWNIVHFNSISLLGQRGENLWI